MPLNWEKYPNFKASEFTCPHSGRADMCPVFMGKLQALRTAYGDTITPTSGYRDPDYNNQISTTGRTGPHTTGKAVDIAIANGQQAYRIQQLAFELGFTGIAVRLKKDGKDFIHLDTCELLADGLPRPIVWTY